jgi:hypothetical protein
MIITHSHAEASFDEDGPGGSSSLVGIDSFPGFVLKAGKLPASLCGGIKASVFSPLPFFLLGANGFNLGFFWMDLDLLSSSSSSGVGTSAGPLKFVSSRFRLFPSILFLSFSSPGPDFTCFSGSSAPTPKLEGSQTVVYRSAEEVSGQSSPWRESHYLFQFLLKVFFWSRRCCLGLQPSRSNTINLCK